MHSRQRGAQTFAPFGPYPQPNTRRGGSTFLHLRFSGPPPGLPCGVFGEPWILHGALLFWARTAYAARIPKYRELIMVAGTEWNRRQPRSEEHTSELQSPCNLV